MSIVRADTCVKYLMLWLALAVGLALGIGSFNLPLYSNLVARGVFVQGTVIELTPEMHGTTRYEYHVGSQIFRNQWRMHPPNPQATEVGQSITICYDPKHPEESVPGDPRSMLTNEILFVSFASISGSAFIVANLAWRARRSRT